MWCGRSASLAAAGPRRLSRAACDPLVFFAMMVKARRLGEELERSSGRSRSVAHGREPKARILATRQAA